MFYNNVKINKLNIKKVYDFKFARPISGWTFIRYAFCQKIEKQIIKTQLEDRKRKGLNRIALSEGVNIYVWRYQVRNKRPYIEGQTAN
jgi:hypothetical protein